MGSNKRSFITDVLDRKFPFFDIAQELIGETPYFTKRNPLYGGSIVK